MDEKYIVPKLLELAKVMYSESEAFAKYSERREVYIFGTIHPFGKVVKNVLHKSVAIYLITNKL